MFLFDMWFWCIIVCDGFRSGLLKNIRAYCANCCACMGSIVVRMTTVDDRHPTGKLPLSTWRFCGVCTKEPIKLREDFRTNFSHELVSCTSFRLPFSECMIFFFHLRLCTSDKYYRWARTWITLVSDITSWKNVALSCSDCEVFRVRFRWSDGIFFCIIECA